MWPSAHLLSEGLLSLLSDTVLSEAAASWWNWQFFGKNVQVQTGYTIDLRLMCRSSQALARQMVQSLDIGWELSDTRQLIPQVAAGLKSLSLLFYQHDSECHQIQ
jgi:hypothetical protein